MLKYNFVDCYIRMICTHGLRWYKKCLQLTLPSYFQKANVSTLNAVNNDSKNHIVWIDMEMTGLDVETSHIMEVACIVTDKNLNVIGNELNIVIHQPDDVLDHMNDWCQTHHKKTGLTDESRLSKTSVREAEKIVLNHLQKHVEIRSCPLAGSSVYMDRMFLYKYMPSVNNYLHYRLIDTSTIKELIIRWNLDIPAFTKSAEHRALRDIKESIKELEHYRKNLFHL
ncbi:putative oligoribonuclease isoform X1 [Halictus rubicundus]|uniref:putative oligoribonuclease isoform X1 n=1 Tax=Halictus rubicundus TaxID=77578 RepID=UPI004037111E